jgi:hypothetical protein
MEKIITSFVPTKSRMAQVVCNWLKSFFKQLSVSFRLHIILFAVVAIYLAGYEFFKYITGTSHTIALIEGFWDVLVMEMIVPVMFPAVLTVRFIRMAFFIRPKKPTVYLINDVLGILFSPQRIANALPVLIAVTCLLDIFSFIKTNITQVNPFSWDTTFMKLDRMIHFGYDPWRLLHPVLAHWQVSLALNIFYNLWFFIMYAVLLWIAFEKQQSVMHMQYLLAFFLCWIVGGSLLACIFSSAGPVYYGHVVPGPNPFIPLLKYLQTTNEHVTLWAVSMQSMLWQDYETGAKSFALGISAMPSMHNATTMLLAFFCWHSGPIMATVGGLYTLAIFLGSIHLGWHYAVDAYMAFILAALCWWMSGHIIRWYLRQPFISNLNL